MFSGRGFIQHTSYLMNHMDKIHWPQEFEMSH